MSRMGRWRVSGALLLAALFVMIGVVGMAAQGTGADGPLVASNPAAPNWKTLLALSDAVVRARVVTGQGRWNADHTWIETDHTLAVRYTLAGAVPPQIQVTTLGGVLPGTQEGMLVFDLPSLQPGEEVLLFLRRDRTPGAQPDRFVIAGNEAGKLAVIGGSASNELLAQPLPLALLYGQLAAAAPGVSAPTGWARQEPATQPVTGTGMESYVYNNVKWASNSIQFRTNINSAHAGGANGGAGDFLTAMLTAADTWNQVDAADFAFVYTEPTTSTTTGINGASEILFIDKGQTDDNGNIRPLAVASVYFRGSTIFESDIWINDAYDWDATGMPSGMEVDLQSVVLHELGHWLSLGHDNDERAVMYPSITLGTLKRALYEDDREGIEDIYPCAGPDACNPAPQVTPTATPSPTAAPTLEPTPTPRPTAAPVDARILPGASGSLHYTTTLGLQVAVEVPADAVGITTTLHMRPAGVDPAPTGMQGVEGFRLSADQGGDELDPLAFTSPLTLTVTYTDTQLAGLDEATLVLLEATPANAAWQDGDCGPLLHDATQDMLTLPVCDVATFGLFAAKAPGLYLPLIQNEAGTDTP